MTPYPADFPLDALSAMTKALRSRDFSDVDGLALAAWNVVGFGLANLVGSGEQSIHVVGQPAPTTKAEALDALEAYLPQHSKAAGAVRGKRVAGAVGAFPIPWSLLIQLAVDLLKKLVEKKTKAGS